MKISNDKPPIWENACAVFKVNPETVIFAYGDTIYNPGKANLPDDLIEHEKVHLMQQEMSPKKAELWWGKYLRDPQFRLSQEVEAYGKQYAYVCNKVQNKQQRFNMLKRCAEVLSGPLYANCVTFIEAVDLIKQEAKKHAPIH